MLTAEQKERRRLGIGSSDIAAIAGFNPFKSKLDVFLEKMGQGTFEGNAKTRHGDFQEEAIAQEYAEITGAELIQGETVASPRNPIMLATPDRLTREPRIIEIKSVGRRMARGWEDRDEPPEYVIAQVQHQLAVLGYEQADVAASIGGEPVTIYNVTFDAELAGLLWEAGERFWTDHVIPKRPPEPQSAEDSERFIRIFHPASSGKMLPSSPDAEAVARTLAEAIKNRDEWAEYVEAGQAKLKMMIGDADGITGIATFKSNKTGTPAWKQIAEELGNKIDPAEFRRIVAEHTGNPGRRFLFKYKEEK